MTIIPRSLRLERFGSFRKRQTFDFPRRPGLYLMLGKNEAEPRLTGNATGKSTLWKGLTWLFFDKTPDGLKAGDICNWDETKNVEVSFEFSEGARGLPQFVTRTWKPNSWKFQDLFGNSVDLVKEPNNPVLASLRMGFQPWLCSVLMAQGEDYFLDMKKDAQAALFGSVMDLDDWIERADRASKAASSQDRITRDLEQRLSEVRGRLDTLERHSQAGDAKKWEKDRAERLQKLDADFLELEGKRKALRKALDEAQGREDEARRGVAAAQPDRALEDEILEVERSVRDLEDNALREVVRRDAVKGYLKDLGQGLADCPTCKRPFDTKHWQEQERKAETQLRALQASIDQYDRRLEPLKNRLKVLDGKLKQGSAERDRARRRLEDAAREVSRARSDLMICDKRMDGLEDEHADLKAQRNPFEGALERARRDADRLRAEERNVCAELEDSERLASIKSYWVRGFKEIRLQEIASALSELEVEVNSCVMELGLVDWELEFHVDRETKAGTVQRGFSVMVRAPGTGDRAVPWESWSGGEKQRLRIAGNMGLGNLTRARTGCDFPLEVWDEPTAGLSPEGKVDLFVALVARAQREGRVIFLVDHQAHDFGGFAGTCTIVKTHSGSRIKASWMKDV